MHLEELEREGKDTDEAVQQIKLAAGHMWTGMSLISGFLLFLIRGIPTYSWLGYCK